MQTPQMQMPPPILAEQSGSGRPRGCACLSGCLIVVMIVIAAGMLLGSQVNDALEDAQGEFSESVPGSPVIRGPRNASCRRVKSLLRERRSGPPVAAPRDLSELINATPPEGFIPEEKLVAQVQIGQWIAGMGDPARWARAFSDNRYRDGLQHFWSTSDGSEMATAQVLQFGDRRGALAFHSFYARQVCGRSLSTGQGPVPGAVHLLWNSDDGWSNEVAFVRGSYFLLTGIHTSYHPRFGDERLTRLAADVFAATARD